jgi:phosphoadenosine phosphosulfate reductase
MEDPEKMGMDVSKILAETVISAQVRYKSRLNTWFEYLPPYEIIQWAVDTFGDRLMMTSAFGLNGVALIHMLQKVTLDVPIVFVDTGYLFAETLETKRRVARAYGVKVLTYRPQLSIEEQALRYGQDLPTRQPDLCCALRKVAPMQRAMEALKPVAVLNSRARFQSPSRDALPVVEWERMPIRINPFALCALEQIEAYVKSHHVPYNPMHDMGYPSIGCRPCTRPVVTGEPVRSGRWQAHAKLECGLWTSDYAATG